MEREIENYLIEAIESYIFGYRIFRMIRNVRLVTIPLLPSSKGGEEKFCITQENAKREIVFVVFLPRLEG